MNKEIEKLMTAISYQLKDIYSCINNYKICEEFNKYFAKYDNYSIFRVVNNKFPIIEQHVFGFMTSSYQCIINSLCNLYEKSNNKIGMFKQIEKQLIEKYKLNLDEYYPDNRYGKIKTWFEKTYPQEVVIARHKFGAHLDLSYDITKNFNKIFMKIDVLEKYFLKSYKNWQYLNNWLSNLGLVKFNVWTIYLTEYTDGWINKHSKFLIDSALNKNSRGS